MNPSWLAVKKLQNVILQTESSSEPVTVADQQVFSEHPTPAASHSDKSIHVTVLKVPVVYDSVLDIVPKLHLRPPILPHSSDSGKGTGDEKDEVPEGPSPPEEGYDLIVHVGVAGPGSLRAEKLAHKYGYNIPDAEGKLAPVVKTGGGKEGEGGETENDAEKFERFRSGLGTGDFFKDLIVRGFAEGYEGFDGELTTSINVDKLVEHLRAVGVDVSVLTSSLRRYDKLHCSQASYRKSSLASTQADTSATSSTIAPSPSLCAHNKRNPKSRALRRRKCSSFIARPSTSR